MDLTWMERAACATPEHRPLFYEEVTAKGEGRKSRAAADDAARTICANCPVLQQCRTWVFSDVHDPCEGLITAGMTTKERRAVRRAANRDFTNTDIDFLRVLRAEVEDLRKRGHWAPVATVARRYNRSTNTIHHQLRRLAEIEATVASNQLEDPELEQTGHH